ncbi:MAG: hypothetical protein LBR18_05735 [Tannerella sp.]|nr:hypothetical protein [Tannerella sp.]
MNGLLAIYKKEGSALESIKPLIDNGLDAMTHRGVFRPATVNLNSELKETDATSSDVRLTMSACSKYDNSLHYASSGGSYIFFEGKLLNKNELCAQLSISPNETSDARIVLALLQKYGEEAFGQLYGYWALVYFDALSQTLYGARDHFGCRTLFFCNTCNQFALATESRALYNIFKDVRKINRYTVIDFLMWGNIGSLDQYFFKDITSVEPSGFVKYEFKTQRLTSEKYYTLPYNRSKASYDVNSEEQYLEGLRTHLAESVNRNVSLIEGAIAVGVSGGMDSSSLICTAKKYNPDRTFVAYTTTDKYDGGEVVWAEKVVRHTGAEWIKVVCTTEDILEKLSAVNRIHNVPLYNASSLAQFRIMEEINRQGQAVFIDGQGGDEMLGGYPHYFPLALKALRNNGELASWWNELTSVSNSGLSIREMFMRRLKLIAKDVYYNPLKFAQDKRKDLYDSLMAQSRDAYFCGSSPVPQVKKEVLNDALFESYTIYLANILRWGEHSAATYGLECIMPLSDYPPLAEYVFSIPSAYKIHDGWNKYLLRMSMEGIVPEEICRRKQKYGFYIPEQNWLNEMGSALYDYLSKTEDPEECVYKKYITENWYRLYTPANPLFQRFAFRCYSYLLWRHGLGN